MSNEERRPIQRVLVPPPEWVAVVLWVLLCVIGWVAASLIGNPLGMGAPIAGVIGGAVLGGVQWLLLNRYMRQAGWWVLATAVGYAVSLTVLGFTGALSQLLIPGSPELTFALAFAISGLIASLPQWMLLIRQVHRSGWWPAASALGWALGWTGVLLFNLLEGNPLMYFSLIGLVYGLVTAPVLVWLMRDRRG